MENLGNCYYCKQPVMAGAGQVIKGVEIIKRNTKGEEIGREEYPTHKRCRKAQQSHSSEK